MELSRKVQELLKSNVTAYRIAKDTGVSQPSITQLRNGNAEILSMSLKNAELLGAYWDKLVSEGILNQIQTDKPIQKG